MHISFLILFDCFIFWSLEILNFSKDVMINFLTFFCTRKHCSCIWVHFQTFFHFVLEEIDPEFHLRRVQARFLNEFVATFCKLICRLFIIIVAVLFTFHKILVEDAFHLCLQRLKLHIHIGNFLEYLVSFLDLLLTHFSGCLNSTHSPLLSIYS